VGTAEAGRGTERNEQVERHKTDAITSNMRFSGTRGREANQVEVKIQVGGETLARTLKFMEISS
jgi:hypothetical protein